MKKITILIMLIFKISISFSQTVNYYSKPGSQFTVTVVKSEGMFYISEELNRISFNRGTEDWFNYLTLDEEQIEHCPKSYMTDSIVLKKLIEKPDSQKFQIVIRIIDHNYNHVNKKGQKCRHKYFDPLCVIVAIK